MGRPEGLQGSSGKEGSGRLNHYETSHKSSRLAALLQDGASVWAGEVLVCGRLTIATGFLQRFRGWLGLREAPESGGLLFRKCSSIHTFGMRFPIDAVFLDESECIIRIETLGPRRIRREPNAVSVLELRAGGAKRASIGTRLVSTDR